MTTKELGDVIQTYWLEPTDKVMVGLHRYDIAEGGSNCETGYHSAVTWLNQIDARRDKDGYLVHIIASEYDEGWPTACQKCGKAFTFHAERNVLQEQIYKRSDNGEEETLSMGRMFHSAIPTASPGAMWNAFWMPDYWRGPDGLALVVRLPGDHDWMVDARANNCTRKDEPHKCWVRHGDPKECHLTVDKDGDTCSAGAGSIDTGEWHGFLRDGILSPA